LGESTRNHHGGGRAARAPPKRIVAVDQHVNGRQISTMISYSDPGVFDLRNYRLSFSRHALLATMAIILVSCTAAFVAEARFGDVAGALIFVLGIVVAGALGGLAAGLIAALAAFLLFNLYFAEPILTLRLATGSDIAPLVVFSLCAVVAGVLAGRLKDRAQAASHSNRQLAGLLEASEALQSAVRISDIAGALAAMPSRETGIRMRLFRVRGTELMPIDPREEDGPWLNAARLCHDGGKAMASHGGLTAYRLAGSEGPVGIIVVAQMGADALDPAYMSGLVTLVALALERASLSEMIAESRANARTEELKTALLSSVSHDFRTPLTAISASASSLIDYRDRLDHETSMRLLRGIVDECERLNRYTANLLEMSRLEAGGTPRPLQTLSVSEMLGTVVQRVRQRAGARRIGRFLGGADLLVNADAALFELVLVNVLDNAILYSEDGTRIQIESEEDDGFCRIIIADEGQGIPEDELGRVFDRFYRIARAEPSPRGSGLGLAIARGFVEALGGTIEAASRGIDDRGARIVIRLPLATEETPS
jgi:two-component system sensor histidine kinase KdpD